MVRTSSGINSINNTNITTYFSFFYLIKLKIVRLQNGSFFLLCLKHSIHYNYHTKALNDIQLNLVSKFKKPKVLL